MVWTNHWVRLPLWPVFLAAAPPATRAALAMGCVRAGRRGRSVCRSCGYDLRATPGRCPECGTIAVAPPAA
jgi:hypothetical protein